MDGSQISDVNRIFKFCVNWGHLANWKQEIVYMNTWTWIHENFREPHFNFWPVQNNFFTIIIMKTTIAFSLNGYKIKIFFYANDISLAALIVQALQLKLESHSTAVQKIFLKISNEKSCCTVLSYNKTHFYNVMGTFQKIKY